MKGVKLGRYLIPVLLFLGNFILQYAAFLFERVGQFQLDIIRSIGIVLLTALALLFLKSEKKLEIFRLRKLRVQDLFATLVGFFLLYAIAILSTYVLIHSKIIINPELHERMRTALYSSKVWGFVLLFELTILAPVYEEVICRGAIQQSYFKNSSSYLDVLLSSSIFAIGHFIGGIFHPLFFIVYCMRGIIYGLLCRYTNSIYYGLLLHVIWNIYASREYWSRWIDNIVFILKLHFS